MSTGIRLRRRLQRRRCRLPLRRGDSSVGAGLPRHPDGEEHGGYNHEPYEAAKGHFSNRAHSCSSPLVFPLDRRCPLGKGLGMTSAKRISA